MYFAAFKTSFEFCSMFGNGQLGLGISKTWRVWISLLILVRSDVVNKRMVTFSERTIFTYYSNHKKHGFDGLKPKRRCDKGTHPEIDGAIIKDILSLKKELPTRSAAKIMIMLILAARMEENSIHIRTINRILNQYGYTRESLSKDTRLYIKH